MHMEPLSPHLLTALSGFLGTTAMTALLWLLTGFRIADVDMVRAIGSLITRSLHKALLPGLLVHFGAGILFSYAYAYCLSIPTQSTMEGYTGLGAFLGFMHGLVVSIALIVLVAEHHPLQRFKKAGFQVALYHLLAHVLYGAVVGLTQGYFALQG